MFNFVATDRLWHASRHAELPAVPWGEHDTLVDLFLVAGGLALILSRATETLIRQELAATQALYEVLHTQLRRHGPVEATAELISEVMHEVAEHADPGTRAALKRCLEARVKFEFSQTSLGRAAARDDALAFFLAPPPASASAAPAGTAQAGAVPSPTHPSPPPAAPVAVDPILPLAKQLRAKVEEARQRREEARGHRPA